MEIWKDIPGYEGYQASTLGRMNFVYNFKRDNKGRFIKKQHYAV